MRREYLHIDDYSTNFKNNPNDHLDNIYSNIYDALQLQYLFIELIETIRPEIISMYTDKIYK